MQGFPDLLSIIDEIRARLIAASEEEVANGKDQWVEDEGKVSSLKRTALQLKQFH